ncbi:hypothetical protein TNCV_2365001 [Trichonephila clavipes]|nr:hypothetical protein TNCV_2365001 [Trichonephila clavipes]
MTEVPLPLSRLVICEKDSFLRACPFQDGPRDRKESEFCWSSDKAIRSIGTNSWWFRYRIESRTRLDPYYGGGPGSGPNLPIHYDLPAETMILPRWTIMIDWLYLVHNDRLVVSRSKDVLKRSPV